MTEEERRQAELRSIQNLTKGTIKKIDEAKKPKKQTKGSK